MEAQTWQVRALDREFPDVFLAKPGQTHLATHYITMDRGKVICLSLRRRPHHLEKIPEDEVEAMLQLGVIEPSQSPWRSHPIMVPKPDRSIRVYIDFRKVNEVSQFDTYPMPVVPGLLVPGLFQFKWMAMDERRSPTG